MRQTRGQLKRTTAKNEMGTKKQQEFKKMMNERSIQRIYNRFEA